MKSVTHSAVVPTAYVRELLKHQRVIDRAAMIARALTLFWLATGVFAEIGLRVGLTYSGGLPSPWSPGWLPWTDLLALILVLVPARFFRTSSIELDNAHETVEVNHHTLKVLERAPGMNHALAAAILLSLGSAIYFMSTWWSIMYAPVTICSLVGLLFYWGLLKWYGPFN